MSNLKSMIDQFYTFVEANPDMDRAVVKKMCNEQLTIGKTGFIFVVDPKGNLLIHQKAEGKNWLAKPHIKKIVEKKNGTLRYLSPVTKTYKLAAFRFFKEWDWIIVGGAFESDFLAAARSEIIKYSAIGGLIILFLAAIVIFLYAVQMTRPLKSDYRWPQRRCRPGRRRLRSGFIRSQSLAEGAAEQAASIEETSSSLEEMSSMTSRTRTMRARQMVL